MESTAPEFLTPGELKERLKISKTAAYDLIGREIPAYRIGDKTVRVRSEDVDAWLTGQKFERDHGQEQEAPEYVEHRVSS